MSRIKKIAQRVTVMSLAIVISVATFSTSTALFADRKTQGVNGEVVKLAVNNLKVPEAKVTPGATVSTNVTFDTAQAGENKITVVSHNLPAEITAKVNGVIVKPGVTVDLKSAKTAKVEYIGSSDYKGTHNINDKYNIKLRIDHTYKGWKKSASISSVVRVSDYAKGVTKQGNKVINQTQYMDQFMYSDRNELRVARADGTIEKMKGSELKNLPGEYVIRTLSTPNAIAYEIDPAYRYTGSEAQAINLNRFDLSGGAWGMTGHVGTTEPGSERRGLGGAPRPASLITPGVEITLDPRGHGDTLEVHSKLYINSEHKDLKSTAESLAKGTTLSYNQIDGVSSVGAIRTKRVPVPGVKKEWKYDEDTKTLEMSLKVSGIKNQEDVISIMVINERTELLDNKTLFTRGEASYKFSGSVDKYRDPEVQYLYNGNTPEKEFANQVPNKLVKTETGEEEQLEFTRSEVGPPGPDGPPTSKIGVKVKTHTIGEPRDDAVSILADAKGELTKGSDFITVSPTRTPEYKYYVEWLMTSFTYTNDNFSMYYMQKDSKGVYHPVLWASGQNLANNLKYDDNFGVQFGRNKDSNRTMHLVRTPKKPITLRYDTMIDEISFTIKGGADNLNVTDRIIKASPGNSIQILPTSNVKLVDKAYSEADVLAGRFSTASFPISVTSNTPKYKIDKIDDFTFAVSDNTIFTYKSNGSGTVAITGIDMNVINKYHGGKIPSTLDFPYMINGNTVNEIADDFGRGLYGKGITEVRMPDSIIRIGDSAFYDNDEALGLGLTKFNIPRYTKTIGYAAFQESKITTLSLPEGLEHIGESAFHHSTNLDLDSKNLPKSLKTIGNGAFANNKITRVVLWDNLLEVGKKDTTGSTYAGAFEGNPIEYVEIRNGVKSIDRKAFDNNKFTKKPKVYAAFQEGDISASYMYRDFRGYRFDWDAWEWENAETYSIRMGGHVVPSGYWSSQSWEAGDMVHVDYQVTSFGKVIPFDKARSMFGLYANKISQSDGSLGTSGGPTWNDYRGPLEVKLYERRPWHPNNGKVLAEIYTY